MGLTPLILIVFNNAQTGNDIAITVILRFPRIY